MNWVDINEQLPPDNNEFGGETYLVTVICKFWVEPNPRTMVMEWECTTIRGKVVKRWRWLDRIKGESWKVTHWMKLPPPATNN